MAFNIGSGLEGKSVVITGGSGGIGREVCLAFAAAGSRVVVVDLDQDRVTAVAAEMEGGPHLAIAHDLRPVAGHPALIAKVTAAFGRLDVLVSTAAVLIRRPSISTSPKRTGISSTRSTSRRRSFSAKRRHER